jgi:DNA-binding transcriptional MerR regulator
VDEPWTLSALVAEVARRIAALPAPRNGQVRAIPDERTIRYYGTIGLLDRPAAMRGRTALYGRKHVAQVVAIKRLQTLGRSLSEIQQLWPTLDDQTLARMSGVELPPVATPPARAAFWKREPAAVAAPPADGGRQSAGVDDSVAGDGGRQSAGVDDSAASDGGRDSAGDDMAPAALHAVGSSHAGRDAAFGSPRAARDAAPAAVELRLELAPRVVLSLSVDESVAVNLSPADVRALRAAAAPLLTELASRRLASHSGGEEP